MASEQERISELEGELDHLMQEVERYRSAAEDALQQLDWCIGFFAGSHRGAIAGALGANRAHIRREYLKRSEQSRPTKAPAQKSA